MRITREVDYALRIVGNLARSDEDVVPASLISEEEQVPLRFTLRILRKLNLAGITEAKRGAAGGYRLCRDPKDINLYQVVTAIDGPIVINRCLDGQDPYCTKIECVDAMGHCKFHVKLGELQSSIIKNLKDSTLNEFI